MEKVKRREGMKSWKTRGEKGADRYDDGVDRLEVTERNEKKNGVE